MNQERQRLLYAAQQGEEAMRRQVIARERERGCTCSEEAILAKRLRGAHAGHEIACQLVSVWDAW